MSVVRSRSVSAERKRNTIPAGIGAAVPGNRAVPVAPALCKARSNAFVESTCLESTSQTAHRFYAASVAWRGGSRGSAGLRDREPLLRPQLGAVQLGDLTGRVAGYRVGGKVEMVSVGAASDPAAITLPRGLDRMRDGDGAALHHRAQVQGHNLVVGLGGQLLQAYQALRCQRSPALKQGGDGGPDRHPSVQSRAVGSESRGWILASRTIVPLKGSSRMSNRPHWRCLSATQLLQTGS